MTDSVYEREFKPYEKRIKQRALEAFEDDVLSGDITTDAVFKGHPKAKAVIIAEDDCIVSGIFEAEAILKDGKLKVSGNKDGDPVKKGDVVLFIEGSLREILMRERTALNYLSRMSGISTLSREIFDEFGRKVLFLRKTDPGLLFSEKKAVALGGCLPHRINLSDGILIKDNHLDELASEEDKISAIRTAVSRAAKYRSKKFMPIEIEVDDLEQAIAAAEELSKLEGPNVIMLDNMNVKQVKDATKKLKAISPGLIIEASGGITRENIKDYLGAGADYVSTSMFISAKRRSFKLELS